MKSRNVLAKCKHDDTQNQDALFDMRVDTITEGIILYFTGPQKAIL